MDAESLEQSHIDYKLMKGVNWEEAHVSIYAVKRTEHNKKNKITGKKEKSYTYRPYLLLTNKKIETKLSKVVTKQIRNWEEIDQYSPGLQDISKQTALWVNLASTNYTEITAQIEKVNSERKSEDTITETSDLKNTRMYIIRLESKEMNTTDSTQHPAPSILYAACRVAKSWGIEKSDPNVLTRFCIVKGGRLLDIGTDTIFSVKNTIDFLSYNNTIFINNKKNFEIVLNIRLTFISKMNEVATDFVNLNLISNKESFLNLIGNNYRNLQKIASIHEKGYYKDAVYLSNLKSITKSDHWYLQFTPDGKIDLDQYKSDPKKLFCMLRELNGERKIDRINGDECYAGAIVQIPK